MAENRRQHEGLAEEQQDDGADRAAQSAQEASSMNGPRMNQFVAPTSFITSISRRREKIESRIVFAMSSVDAITRRITAMRKTSEITFPIVSTRFVIELAQMTPPASPSWPAVAHGSTPG